MPVRFRAGYKKRYTSSKRTYGRGSNAGRVAAQAARRVIMSMGGRGGGLPTSRRGAYIRSGVMNELNYKDYASGGITAINTGVATQLCAAPAVGTTSTSRQGDKVNWKSMDLNLEVYASGAATASCQPTDTIRIIMLWVKNPGGAGTPSIYGTTSSILDNTTIAMPFSPFNYDARDRFIVVFDKRVMCSDYDTTLKRACDPSAHMSWNYRVKKSFNYVSTIGAAAGASTDYQTMLPLLVVLGEGGAAGFNVAASARWRFVA